MVENSQPVVPGVQEHPSLALVNSVTDQPGSRRHDDLADPVAATAWLVDRDLVAPEAVLYEHCRGRLAELRAELRELFTAHVTGRPPKPEAVAALNRALTSAPGAMLLRHHPTMGFSRSADHPATQVVENAMAVIAEDAAALLAGDDASLLAACESDSCQWFFLRTHARRQWCSNRCGDRVRAARAYARRHAVLSEQTS
ncbi:CGNR zinc finger domain-containing protein [Rhodococcus sp. X156]|uniref:CGNR zinc finger domain-containing protein n=1 Tax=Rhodococcus sp. X156 TaxID=2499145 RepID=UPI000FDB8CB6|nr:CGNR zinc finger domain-containing protein [Rhodococcus sp. X156]